MRVYANTSEARRRPRPELTPWEPTPEMLREDELDRIENLMRPGHLPASVEQGAVQQIPAPARRPRVGED